MLKHLRRYLDRRRDEKEHPGETPAIRQTRRLAELTGGGGKFQSSVNPPEVDVTEPAAYRSPTVGVVASYGRLRQPDEPFVDRNDR